MNFSTKKRPRKEGQAWRDLQRELDERERLEEENAAKFARIDALRSRNVLSTHTGDARIESYTVIYGARGPAVGHLACLTEAGDRVWANVTDLDVLDAMPREEFCGRAVRLSGESPPQILD